MHTKVIELDSPSPQPKKTQCLAASHAASPASDGLPEVGEQDDFGFPGVGEGDE